MYCPKCAAQNSEDIKFCRSCGANVSLVSKAIMTGELMGSNNLKDFDLTKLDHSKNHIKSLNPHDPVTIFSHGLKETFLGIGFLLTALFLWMSKANFAVWLLIPAFALLGKGISQMVAGSLNHKKNPQQNLVKMDDNVRVRSTDELAQQQPNKFEILPPPSVTETTTRHLDLKVKNSK